MSIKQIVFLFIIGLIILSACTDDKAAESPGSTSLTDKELFDLNTKGGYSYYKNNPDTFPFTPMGNGHGGFIRVKFNDIAKNALDSNGELPQGATFPEGSVIIKEIYSTSGAPLKALAIMYKSYTDANASSGWVWGEYNSDGSNIAGVSGKGIHCVSCHSRTASDSEVQGDGGNRDLVRIFGLR